MVDGRRAMCRLLISWGKPSRSHMLSFVEISRRDRTKGWSHGSGWGVLYARKGTYGVYKSTSSIWESFVEPPDGYLLYLFHSRLASVGAVSLANTHPIIYGRYAIAHNGTIDKEAFGRRAEATRRRHTHRRLHRHRALPQGFRGFGGRGETPPPACAPGG